MPDGLVEQEAAPAEGEITTESASGEQQEPQEGQQKPRGGFQKRIDKLVKSNTQLEQEREFWRQQALRTAPVEAKTEQPKGEGEPSESDFQTHAEYVKALARYEAKQAVQTVRAEQVKEEVRTQQQKALQEFGAREQAFAAATPGYAELMAEVVAEGDITISDALRDEIVASEHGPALKFFLAQNPEEAERLSELKPMQLAREVGRIEARFSSSQEKTPVKTTGAPPPPTPTSKSTATSTKDPGEMNPQEYRAWRAKQNA